ncbi:MAG TPA: hypothetical protein VG937_33465 [Polyangiaceae bacterium]|nr:hypothetical protein [Polyangiaceae bacterium]
MLLACSPDAGETLGSGGTGTAAGGATGTGGTPAQTGGTPSTGGFPSTTGGTPGATTGGTTSTGGSVSTGGSIGTTGGSVTTGGVGGGSATGGSPMTGGTPGATGGGGSKSTGGNAATGGSGTTGGSAATGGSGGGGTSTSKFSFFVTSYAALTKLSGSMDGFGGDLRYGETGDGAGLRGADKICAAIAESVVPGSGTKQWRAFLSAGGEGVTTVNAIDRIGNGPWYDRLGRLFSASKANLIGFRPSDADPLIKNDFPNENGTPNHNPDGRGQVDNHDTLTGTGADGKLYTGGTNPTCTGWTTKVGSAGKPHVGHAWPRTPSANNTCMAGGGFPGGGAGGSTGDPATAGCYGHWMSSLDEAGCAPGASLVEMGPPNPNNPTVGSGGGYGGWFCFALTP